MQTALAFLEDREGLKAAKAEKDYHEINRLHAAVKKVMEKARREEVEASGDPEVGFSSPTWKIKLPFSEMSRNRLRPGQMFSVTFF